MVFRNVGGDILAALPPKYSHQHLTLRTPCHSEQGEESIPNLVDSNDNNSIPTLINGIENHIHILCVQSINIALAKLVEEIKRHSSRWIKTINKYYSDFKWQGGYGAFSVSPSLHDKTKSYIATQEQHHKEMTFKEEYLLFLKEYGIE